MRKHEDPNDQLFTIILAILLTAAGWYAITQMVLR